MSQNRFFFAAGPGNIIQAHKDWRAGIDHPSQTSITFSSEFAQFCIDNDASALFVSMASPAEVLSDREFRLEHRPKRRLQGWKFHLEEIRYGLELLRLARRFGATHAFIQSGSTHYFLLILFRLWGIKVIPIMHNTLWPKGFPETSLQKRALLFLDAIFFRYFANAVVAVSDICAKQIDTVTGGHSPKVYLFKPQYNRSLFDNLSRSTPPKDFTVVFASRIVQSKGALDLPAIAEQASKAINVRFHICGDGPDLEKLKAEIKRRGLENIVQLHGWTAPAKLKTLISESHAAIVPTRSSFNEGMAMTAIEPVLLGKPVITNPVVPAFDILRPACAEAQTDDVQSYSDQIVRLATNRDVYSRLSVACFDLREQFFDRKNSSRAALQRTLQ